jgi:hypothetical protein
VPENEKKKKISGVRIILTAFLVSLLLAAPFVTDCLLVGEVTGVFENTMCVKNENGYEMRVTGTDLTVKVSNPALFRWLDRLLTGRGEPYTTVRLHVNGTAAYGKGDPVLALIRGGQEDSDPPGLGAWWIR